MSVEFSPTVVRPRFQAISWPAIFAALAVAVAVQLLLSLAGIALGVYAFEAGEASDTITLAAASWGAVSMMVAAFIGGYVAARSSGLRRVGDGVLHGVVSWAATTVLYAALATTAIGALTTGLFGLLGPGLVADNTRDAAQAVGSGTLWLSGAVVLSLLLGIVGGMIGVRGSRRSVRRERERMEPRPRILSRT